MVPPLHGVSSAVSCSGTLDQGSLFRFEFIKITLLSLLFELSSCVRLTCAMLLVWDVARHGISTPFLKNTCFFFSDSRFVIRAIYLSSFFQPLPRWWTITRGPDKIWRWCEGSGASFHCLRMRSRSTRKYAHMNAGDLGSILAVCACDYDPIHVTAQGKSLGPNCACVQPPRN